VHRRDRRRLSPRQDIINVILSRGELTRDDIKLMWGLDEDAYAPGARQGHGAPFRNPRKELAQ
jgi:hypothetical protein